MIRENHIQRIIWMLLVTIIFQSCQIDIDDSRPLPPLDSTFIGKKMRIITIRVWQSNHKVVNEYIYDTNGVEIGFNPGRGNVPSGRRTDYKYDVKGNLISYKALADNNNNAIATSYTYDLKDSLISKIDSNSIYGVVKDKYLYAPDGRQIGHIHTHTNGDSYEYLIYNYDENGRILYKEASVLSNIPRPLFVKNYTYKYSESGKLIEKIYNSSHFNGSRRYAWEYDSQDRIISHKWYQNEYLRYENVNYKYDSLGRISSYDQFNGSGGLNEYTNYEYEDVYEFFR